MTVSFARNPVDQFLLMPDDRTTVTQQMLEGVRNPQPSSHNGRAKPGIAKHHQGKKENEQ